VQLALQEMEIDLEQAQSDVENAQANIANLTKIVEAQQSQVGAAELTKNKSARDLARNKELENAKAITHQQFLDSQDQGDLATVRWQGAKADLVSTKSKMGILQANLHKSQVILKLKRVKIDQQKLRLAYAKIVAPADGKIGKKAVEPGQFVQVSQPLMTVMNDTKYWVVANFKETQVDALHAGMDAEIKIDAYPELKIKGRILSISESTGAKNTLLPPDNSSGNFVKVTQRVPVKIEIVDAQKYQDILRAGLSLEVSIPLK
jgi:membrane fusion protein (multidrug efflux system)